MNRSNFDVYKLIVRRRTIRRFTQKPIPFNVIKDLVNSARLAPSSANKQPLEYLVIDDREILPGVFSTLKWAGYIAPEGNPPPGQQPAAYIIVLVNKKIRIRNYQRDVGASCENIILAALERGIGSCWICSINRRKLRTILSIPSYFIIDTVIALGYPAESPVIEEIDKEGSIKYWKDEEGRLHVPKRRLEDILWRNSFSGQRI